MLSSLPTVLLLLLLLLLLPVFVDQIEELRTFLSHDTPGMAHRNNNGRQQQHHQQQQQQQYYQQQPHGYR